MSKFNKFTPIIVAVVLIFAGFAFFMSLAKETKETQAPKSSPDVISPERLGAGKVGESQETFKGETLVALPGELGGPEKVILPPAIFNGSGLIKEIKETSLIIESTGYNFADQKPRDLTLIYNDYTKTIAGDMTKSIKGPEGLKELNLGEAITFESPENIRGKTEFEVLYINKL